MKEKYCWYTETNKSYNETFDSLEKCLENAVETLKDKPIDYVYVGAVEYLDKDYMIDSAVIDMIISLDNYVEDFVFGVDNFDYTAERYNKDLLHNKIKEAVVDVIDKYYDPTITSRSNTFKELYNVKERKWYFPED